MNDDIDATATPTEVVTTSACGRGHDLIRTDVVRGSGSGMRLLAIAWGAVLMAGGCDYAAKMVDEGMKSAEELHFESRLFGSWTDGQGNGVVFYEESAKGHPPVTFMGKIWPYDWRGDLVGGTWDVLYRDDSDSQPLTCWSHNGEYRETTTFRLSFVRDSLIVKEGNREFRLGQVDAGEMATRSLQATGK